ncbi:MAG: helix-turn-helix domain-containing protein, partial [Candidatus Micrarchaeota archaeon]
MLAKLLHDEKTLDCLIMKDGLEALSADRLRILRAFNEPKYPAQVARELKMQVQTAYYHVRLLEQAGLLKKAGTEEKGGALAKKFEAAE